MSVQKRRARHTSRGRRGFSIRSSLSEEDEAPRQRQRRVADSRDTSREVKKPHRRLAAVLAQQALTKLNETSDDEESHPKRKTKPSQVSSDLSDDESASNYQNNYSSSDELNLRSSSRLRPKRTSSDVSEEEARPRRSVCSASTSSSGTLQSRRHCTRVVKKVLSGSESGGASFHRRRHNGRGLSVSTDDESSPRRCRRMQKSASEDKRRQKSNVSSDDSEDEEPQRPRPNNSASKGISNTSEDENDVMSSDESDEELRCLRLPSQRAKVVSDSDDEVISKRKTIPKRRLPTSSSSCSSDEMDSTPIRRNLKRSKHILLSSSESEVDSDGPSLPRKAVGKALKSDASMSECSDSDSSCSSADRCVICFKSLADGAVARPSACKHIFHDECLRTWSKTSNTCPIDRVKYSATHRLKCPDADAEVLEAIRVATPPPQAHYDEEDLPTAAGMAAAAPSTISCQVCRASDREEEMLLCDRCESGYHLDCLQPPLRSIPVGDWFCPHCLDHDYEPIDDDELLYLFAESELTNSRLRMRARGRSAVLLSATVRAVSNLAAVTSSLRNPYQDSDDEISHATTVRGSSSRASSSRASSSRATSSRAGSSHSSTTRAREPRAESSSSRRGQSGSRRRQSGSRPHRCRNSRSGGRSGQRRYRVELVTTEDGETVEVKVAIHTRRRRRRNHSGRSASSKHKKSAPRGASRYRRSRCNDSAGPSTSWDNGFAPAPLDITGSRPTLDYFSPDDEEDVFEGGLGSTAMLARSGRVGGRSSLTSRKEVARVLSAPRPVRPRPRVEPVASSSSASILDSILREQELWHAPNTEIVASPSGQVRVRLPSSATSARTAATGDTPVSTSSSPPASSGSSASSANNPPTSANSPTSASPPPSVTTAPLAPPPPPPMIPPPQPPLKLYEDDDFDLYADIEPARPQPRELAPPPAPPVGLLLAAPASSPEPDDEAGGGLVIASPPRPPLPPDAYNPESPDSPLPSPPKPPPPPPEDDDDDGNEIPLPSEPPRKDSVEERGEEGGDESDGEVPIAGYYSAAAQRIAACSDSDSEPEREPTEMLVERLRHAGPLGKKKLAALAAPAESPQSNKPRISFGVMRRTLLPLRRGDEKPRDWFETSRKTPTKAELKGADPEGALDLSVDAPSPSTTSGGSEVSASPIRKLHLLRATRSSSHNASPYTPASDDPSEICTTPSSLGDHSEDSIRRRKTRWDPSPDAPSPSSQSTNSSEGSRKTRYTLLPKGRRKRSPVEGITRLDPPAQIDAIGSSSPQDPDKYDPAEGLSDGSPSQKEMPPPPDHSPKSPSLSSQTEDEKGSEGHLKDTPPVVKEESEAPENMDDNEDESVKDESEELVEDENLPEKSSCMEIENEDQVEPEEEPGDDTERLEGVEGDSEITEELPAVDELKQEKEGDSDGNEGKESTWNESSPDRKVNTDWEKETPMIKSSNWEEETPAVNRTDWETETPAISKEDAEKIETWEKETPAVHSDGEEEKDVDGNENVNEGEDECALSSREDQKDKDDDSEKEEEEELSVKGRESAESEEDEEKGRRLKKRRPEKVVENGHKSPSWQNRHSVDRCSLSSGEVGSSPQYERSDSGLVDVTDDEERESVGKTWSQEPHGLEGLGTEAISDGEEALATPAAERPRPQPQPKEEGEIITDDRNEFIPWKRVGKTTKERTYREKDKTDERETTPEKRKKEKRKEKRQELERYNVRKMLSDKPKRRRTDEFGRDVSSSSGSDSGEREGLVRSEVKRIGSDWERKERRRDDKRRRSLSRTRRKSRSPRRRLSPRNKDRPRLSSKDRRPDRRSRTRSRSRSRSRGRGRDRNKRDPKASTIRKKSDRKKSPAGSDYSVSTCSCSSCEREKLSQAKKITVTVPNNTVKKTKEKKKDKTRKSKKDKRRRTESPVPSKEVFTSGDNILVSVSFRSGAKNDPKRNGPRRIWEDEARKKKDKENQPARTVIPILAATQEKDRRKQRRKMAGNAKPIAIIDLDPSPFREQALSPTEVIVLTDESDNEGGPKTPPEPPVKFSIGPKGPTLRALANPLEEGPPTPAADTYDPFEPTKSPSVAGSPAPVVPAVPAVPAPPPPPASPGVSGPPAPVPSSPPSGPGLNGDSPYSPGSSEGDDLFEPPPASPAPAPAPAPQQPKPLPRLALPLPPVNVKPSSKAKRRLNSKFKKGGQANVRKDGTGTAPASKLDEDQLKMLDEMPNSAVEMQFLKKLNRQERVVEEVKFVLKPHYNKKHITKEEYKEIMRRAVPKICHSRSGEIHPIKIQTLIEAYVKKYRCKRKKSGAPPVTTPQPPAPPSGIQPLKGKAPKVLPPILNMIMGNLGTRSQDTFNRNST